MSISTCVSSYLESQNISYKVVSHAHSNSSISTANAAHIPAERIAKAVVLEDDEGRRLMAVLPANYKISLHMLRDQLKVLDLHVVNESQVYKMFNDCEPGAIPAIGQAFNLHTVYDESLDNLVDIYLEAGDHETLIHLTHNQFEKLMGNIKHSRFSGEVVH